MSPHREAARDTIKAIAINGGIGLAEILVGGTNSSQALLADSAHNIGDAAGYGINIVPHTSPEKAFRYRRVARTAVCAGAAAVALYSSYELTQASERPTILAPALAGVAVVATRRVHDMLDDHSHLSESHQDSTTHARSDMYCSRVTLLASVMAYGGVPHADEVGSLLVAGVTIWINRPTQSAMSQNL